MDECWFDIPLASSCWFPKLNVYIDRCFDNSWINSSSPVIHHDLWKFRKLWKAYIILKISSKKAVVCKLGMVELLRYGKIHGWPIMFIWFVISSMRIIRVGTLISNSGNKQNPYSQPVWPIGGPLEWSHLSLIIFGVLVIRKYMRIMTYLR
jgi:hypothetical protein